MSLHAPHPSILDSLKTCYTPICSTNGIGLSVARTLFKHGGRVILLGSKQETGDAACEYIKTGDLDKAPHDYKEGFGSQRDNSANGATKNGQVEWRKMDGSDLKEVADVAKTLVGELDRLDGFFAIAGLGVNAFELTKDGYECVTSRLDSAPSPPSPDLSCQCIILRAAHTSLSTASPTSFSSRNSSRSSTRPRATTRTRTSASSRWRARCTVSPLAGQARSGAEASLRRRKSSRKMSGRTTFTRGALLSLRPFSVRINDGFALTGRSSATS